MANVTIACRDITELTPLAQQACNLFMAKCKAAGLNVLITETYRSQDRQYYLYAQGRTRTGAKVTWTHNSRHTSRRAWDICQNIKGKEYSDISFFAKAGQIAASLGITWGGTWTSSPDRPHFEISNSWKAPATVIIKAEEEENMTRYNKIEEVPDWAKETISKLIDKGAIADKDNLNLSEDMLRVMVIMSR